MTILTSITVLKLKLQSEPDCLMPIAKICRKGRNVAVEDWLLRNRGKPESARQSAKRKPYRRRDESGQLVDPEDCTPKPLSETSKMYHAIKAECPELSSWMVSMIAGDVWKQLKPRVDWRKGMDENGKRPRRLDEILAYESRPPFFHGLQIPLHNLKVSVEFGDSLGISVRRLEKETESQPLSLSIRQIPPGKQAILRDLAAGERKLADSKLVYQSGEGKKKKGWYWYVPVAFHHERRSNVEATLAPIIDSKDVARFFVLTLPSGRTFNVGDALYLRAMVERLVGLRKQIGERSRFRITKGHGRRKIDASVRRRWEQLDNVFAEVRRRAIVDVVKWCARKSVGVLKYREPTGPVKTKCWFDLNGVRWDWTRFRQDLINNAARKGIEVVSNSSTLLRWKEAMPGAEAEAGC